MKTNSSKHILIVDDESEMRAALNTALDREGFNVVTADNGKSALKEFEGNEFDLVITDVKMPQMNGVELLREINKRSPKTFVIMMTAYGTIDNAVETMKDGAFDYLLKPFSADVLISTVNRVFHTDTPPQKPTRAPEKKKANQTRQIITQDAKMKDLIHFVDQIAYSKSTVLISGETGTGKELIARHIHQQSPRSNMPFLAVNCAALPEGLLESELFGHEKGAFTGAINRKEGKFELANRGTLLLDEVTEMSQPLQAKLLRVLQEHEIDKVGGREPIPVDVRVIATTNKDPRSLITDNKFREDLYYRLNVIPLKVPPLRERMEDIPLLAQHFIEKHSKANGKEVKGIADETVALLKKYQWRGNIREMENIIERAVLLCQGETILPSNLFMDEDSESQTGANDKPLSNFRGTIYQMEKELIQQTLVEVDGNKTRAAEALGISIRTLRNKLTEYREKDQNQ